MMDDLEIQDIMGDQGYAAFKSALQFQLDTALDAKISADSIVAPGFTGGGFLNAFKNGLKALIRVAPSAAPKAASSLYNFARAPSTHMENPARFVPLTLLDKAIKFTKGMKDPRGSKALMHYSKINIRNKPYNLEVLFDKKSNTILHFEYARKAMGPLDAIK